MDLKSLILKRAREYMATHHSATHAQAIDAALQAEAGEQAATPGDAGFALNELATARLAADPALKGDYTAAFQAVCDEHPALARLYEQEQNPHVHSRAGVPATYSDEFTKEQPGERMRKHAEASEEVDRAVQTHQARNPGTEYAAALDAVLTSDPDLRRRYGGS